MLGSKVTEASMNNAIGRALMLGTAAGMRSSLGFSAPKLVGRQTPTSTIRQVWSGLPIAGELIVDKLPQTPSRLLPPGLIGRFTSGAFGAFLLARRQGAALPLPVLAGIAGAAAGAYGGAAWRRWADAKGPDWPAAVAEDALALTLAAGACRSR
jgi:uncharacterized membrane protein